MDKHELKIEAEEHFLEHGALNKTQLEPNNVHIKIYAGDTLVAETNLESLVMKFLVVSAEHAKMLATMSSNTRPKGPTRLERLPSRGKSNG